MKHHFGDFLDREGDYWTIVPNNRRYAYEASDDIEDKEAVRTITISKQHEKWRQVLECPNLEELTLHDPSKEQVREIQKLTQIKRLRVTFFRATDLEFVAQLGNVEELVLEYVSGFSDLSPLSRLTKLKSIHMENLRRVSNFDGLRGLTSLRYLYISGTLDWKQPIENFEFLSGLPNLEVFSLWLVTNKSEFPALLPILKLKKLKKIHFVPNIFKTEEYAFLQVAFPSVEGSSWEPYYDYGKTLDFLGKNAGRVFKTNPLVKEKCAEFVKRFEEMKKEAEVIINQASAFL